MSTGTSKADDRSPAKTSSESKRGGALHPENAARSGIRLSIKSASQLQGTPQTPAQPAPVASPKKRIIVVPPKPLSMATMLDMRGPVALSLELEKELQKRRLNGRTVSEEKSLSAADKKRLSDLTSLDMLLRVPIAGSGRVHDGYLTYTTLSLLEDSPESSKDHFFTAPLTETQIRARYLEPQSMAASLAFVAQDRDIDDSLIESLATSGVPSAEDVAEGKQLSDEPASSILRRLDELYDDLEPILDENDLRTMIADQQREARIKSIKKRQRPSDMQVPKYITEKIDLSRISADSLLNTDGKALPRRGTEFELPHLPAMIRGPASKKRRLYIQGCVPVVEYSFVDAEVSDEEEDLGNTSNMSSARLWMMIAKREIPRAATIRSEASIVRRSNARTLALAAQIDIGGRVNQIHSKSKEMQLRSRSLSKSIYSFIKKSEKEWRKQAEKEAESRRKAVQEEEDKERAAKKLNFLLNQTELYSHFMSKKLGITAAEAEVESMKKPAGANGVEIPVGASLVSMAVDDQDQEAKAREQALRAFKDQRAKIESFDAQSSALRGTGIGQVHGHRKTGGLVTHNLPTVSAGGGDGGTGGEGGKDGLIEQPRDLVGNLKPYQLKGLNWLINLYEQGINGILADEMGLGKTVQTISLLAHLAEQRGIWGPFIVIAPTSTLPNWVNEFTKFYPAFKVLPYYGMAKQRAVLRKVLNPNYLHRPDSVVHVVVTSYNLVVHDEKYISRIHWEYMILDEAHAIKSANSVRWNTLLGFGNTRNRLLLTGTPIQNNMAELWALLHFIMPTLFDSHNEFSEWFSKDIEEHAAGAAGLNEHQLNRLHMILKPFMLRRVKVDVQNELPPKQELEIKCDLTPRQLQLYNGIRNHLSVGELFDRASLPMGRMASERQAKTLMNIVMQFRNVCNHPEILDKSETVSPLQFSPVPPPTVSHNTIVASGNRNFILYHLPRLIYEETMAHITVNDPTLGGFRSDQTTRHKWLRHRFSIYAQLNSHSAIFNRKFESGHVELHDRPYIVPIASHSRQQQQAKIDERRQPLSATTTTTSSSMSSAAHQPVKMSFQEKLAAKRQAAAAAAAAAAASAGTALAPIAMDSPGTPSSSHSPHSGAPSATATSSSSAPTRTILTKAEAPDLDRDHTWDFIRLADLSPAEVEWFAQADIFSRWMAHLGTRERDSELSHLSEQGLSSESHHLGLNGHSHAMDVDAQESPALLRSRRRTSASMLRIVPVLGPLTPSRVQSHASLSELVVADPMKRLESAAGPIRLARGAYFPLVWSAPPSIYCNDRRFTHTQLASTTNDAVTRLLLGRSRNERSPEDLVRVISSVRLVRPSVPMAAPVLNVFGASDIRVPNYAELVRDSGKLKYLDTLLKRLKREGHRVLVYSQFTEVLDLLEDFMHVRSHKFVRLDGSSKLDDRRDMVDAFQSDTSIFVFLLSTRAGGLGINLTAADTVIFYDSDWNPTMDAQAMDRAHRLGQTRPVTVYRLVTRNSIEERILFRAKQKGTIQNLVIQGGRFNLSPDEADDIFKPSEMMDLLLDENQLEDLSRAENAKKRRPGIINPIKIGMKRSAQPSKPVTKASTPAPATLTFDESVEPSTSASIAPTPEPASSQPHASNSMDVDE